MSHQFLENNYMKNLRYFSNDRGILYKGDSLDILNMMPIESVDVIITSPPYYSLRDYGVPYTIFGGKKGCKHEWEEHRIKPKGGRGSKGAKVGSNKNDFSNMRDHDVISYACKVCGAWRGNLGLEPHPDEFIKHLSDIFDGCMRVLNKQGTLWIVIGDSYSTYKGFNNINGTSLIGIPDRLKIELIDRGWICKNDIIWHKPNVSPENVKRRFTRNYERVLLFAKDKRYYFKQQFESSVEGKSRNKRCIWDINVKPYFGSHTAVFPEELVENMISPSVPKGGTVLDPFMGAGTVAKVCEDKGIKWVGIELSEKNCSEIVDRINE